MVQQLIRFIQNEHTFRGLTFLEESRLDPVAHISFIIGISFPMDFVEILSCSNGTT